LIPGAPEWGLKVSVRELERMLPAATGLILNSPCNPTGSVYTHGELKALATWAKTRHIWVIADEIYRRIHYGTGPAPSFLDLPDEFLERVIVIYGVSKAYAMTGWRIGLALAPAAVAKAMAALQSHTTTGANHPAQYAAAAALSDPRVEEDVARMVAEFRRRRDLGVARFRQAVLGAGALWAQDSPVRPRLAAEADTNDWQAYFDYGVEQLQRVPGRADAAFYWAGRLDPWRSEPFYGRWVTYWMRHDGDWADYLAENPRILRKPEVRRADSLLLAALVRNPLTSRRLEALVYHSVPGEWGHDLATEGYLAYAAGRYGDAVKVWGRLVLQDSVRNVWWRY